MYLNAYPRYPLATLPTALDPAPRLSAALGGKVEIWLKRDDNTGLALGGNKARKLEFLLGEAIAEGADTLITTGGPQSNHCRMTAAAAVRAGMDCHLVFSSHDNELRQGNLLLDKLLGANFHFAGSDPAEVSREMSNLAERLRAEGRRPYVIPLGGSTRVGALGYVAAVREMLQQAESQKASFTAIVHASGSGGTQAGLVAGALVHHLSTEVIGVSVSRKADVLAPRVAGLVDEVAALLGVEIDASNRVEVDDAFVGAGYGIPNEASQEALQLLARTEGVIVDPVYTAKGMAGLIAAVREQRWPVGSRILFWHTGGSPALFADSCHWRGDRI